MIAGIGIDVVDIERFARALARTPRLVDRLFAESERARPARSLAARFAAKEALIKALGGRADLTWHDMVVVQDAAGNPDFALPTALAQQLRRRGVVRVHLSMSHDAGIASAFVVLESDAGGAGGEGLGAAAAIATAERATADAGDGRMSDGVAADDDAVAAGGGFREARVDLDAIRRNVRSLVERMSPAAVMVVVKADAYGHGAVPVARAALDAGAHWLGVADLGEAVALRDAGIDAPLLAWLHDPGADYAEAVARAVDVGLSSAAQLRAVAHAAAALGATAHVHLKIDTGLGRNGVHPDRWPDAVALAAELERAGHIRVRGVFSHLANASDDEDAAQLAAFEEALAAASAAGLEPELRHIAASAAALRVPAARYDLVRLGISVYGVPPYGDGTTAAELGLRPAMTLRGRVAAVRRLRPGAGVSYGYTWRAERPTTVALVPLGYADGVPRHASGRAEVLIGGTRRPVIGRVAMDQFLVDVGDDPVSVGDEVVLFGDPTTGAPSADDWGDAAGTIGYEIVTRVGPRVPRTYGGT